MISFVGLLVGAVLGYFIAREILGSDDNLVESLIGIMIGMIITYALIIGVKEQWERTGIRIRMGLSIKFKG